VPGSNGNGTSKKPEGVPQVKVRVGVTQITDEHTSNGRGRFGNGHSNGLNGGETRRIPPSGQNGNGNGFKARVSPSTVADSASRHTTSSLRDTDITGLRLKLKRQEWSYTPAGKRQVHKRALPYFLMRHRVMRSRSTVGHTRARVAGRKYKKVGILSLALYGSLSLFMLMIMLFGAGVGGAFAGTLWYMENKLPPVTDIHGINVQTTKIYDRNGIPLFDLVDEETGRRREVRLSEISPLIISATIAAEDATFYSNPGVEPVALLRAVYINYSGSGSSGASTITQQVVRNVNLPDE
jgi:hypothetical protein